MKEILISSIFLFYGVNVSAQAVVPIEESCVSSESSFNCVEFIRNYDADTITFNIPNTHPLIGKNIAARVNGIDTPEIRTKDKCEKTLSVKAKKFVEAELKNAKRIDLRNIKRGKYFRIVADIHYDGKSLVNELLKRDMGYPYDGGRKPTSFDWCDYLKKANEHSR